MPTVDFLPFAIGAGANVETQSDYVTDATLRSGGFVAGVAPSAKFNKALRQSSVMASVLAQAISDISGQNVLDDGVPATILANLKSAMGSRAGHTYALSDWCWLNKSDGIILQWGSATVTGGAGSAIFTFPASLTTSMFAVVNSCALGNVTISYTSNSLSTCTVTAYFGNSGAAVPNGSIISFVIVGK